MRRASAWAVYRHTVDLQGDPVLEIVGLILAEFEGTAAALAHRLPRAPLHPVLCRAAAVRRDVPVISADGVADAEIPGMAGRRSRRRHLLASAALAAESSGRAA